MPQLFWFVSNNRLGADWLQGPYTYALYVSQGLSMEEIARVFVVGHLSAMMFGSLVGSLADS